jgi:biopolymer transport protein ExbD
MKTHHRFVSIVLLLAACRTPSQRADAAVASTASVAPTAIASAHLVADAAEAGGAVVIVSKHAIVVDDTPILTLSGGIDAKYTKRGDDAYVVPLALELDKIRERDKALRVAQSLPLAPSEATLIVDKSTPYRIVAPVLYTLSQTGFGRYHFMVLRDANEKQPAAAKPRHPAFSLPPIAAIESRLGFSVRIDANGFTLRAASDGIAPGCNHVGSGVTLPKRDSAYDFEALTTCARAIRTATSVGDSDVVLAPDMDVEYEAIIQTMDALSKDDAGPLFPDARFATTR